MNIAIGSLPIAIFIMIVITILTVISATKFMELYSFQACLYNHFILYIFSQLSISYRLINP
ncbi:hypothetical protein TXYLGN1_08930 [Tepidimicrobium xylanilyticum]